MNAKLFLIIFASAFLLLIFSYPIFNLLESNGVIAKETTSSSKDTILQTFQFVMFCIMGFSIVPIMIRLFVFLQLKIGNAELALVQFLQTHEQGVVLGVWCFFIVGLCIIVPGIIKKGF